MRKLLLLLPLVCLACGHRDDRMREAPKRILWAWETSQDLRFLDRRTGVAFLAGELHLRPSGTEWRPRRNPLHLSPGAWRMAVLRLESHGSPLEEVHQAALLTKVWEVANLPGVRAIQLDFDARSSERAWYRAALARIRGQLPRGIPLSITALASWCWDDPWMAGLPVDEAVPMLFRMGPSGERYRTAFERREPRRFPPSRFSVGLSTDERIPEVPSGQRIYLFHPGPWTQQDWERVQPQLP